MKIIFEVDEEYIIPNNYFDNILLIEQRTAKVPQEKRTHLGALLRYLYQKTGGRMTLDKAIITSIEHLILPSEKILARWLQTRTNGSEKRNYGPKALIAARNAHYRCEDCGFPDVRTLQLDHVNGRSVEAEFRCLCANCHQIKSRKHNWSGVKMLLESRSEVIQEEMSVG